MSIYHPDNIQSILTVSQKLLDGASLTDFYIEEIFDKKDIFFVWKDDLSNFLGCNLQVLKIAGFANMNQIIGKSDYDLPASIEQANKFRNDDAIVRSLKCPALNLQEIITTADGQDKTILTNKFPIMSTNRNKCGVLCISTDISEYKKVEKNVMHYLASTYRNIPSSICNSFV